MEGIRKYIISVVAAAIICAVVKLLIDQKSAPGAVVKLIAGVLLTVTVIGPVTNIQFMDLSKYVEDFTLSADTAVDAGTAYAAENTAVIIKQRTEAYILDKAQLLGADVQVDVILSEESVQRPCTVVVTGNLSPYAKQKLMTIIVQDLGIPEENQVWQ